jgi:hypothetical protein
VEGWEGGRNVAVSGRKKGKFEVKKKGEGRRRKKKKVEESGDYFFPFSVLFSFVLHFFFSYFVLLNTFSSLHFLFHVTLLFSFSLERVINGTIKGCCCLILLFKNLHSNQSANCKL